MAYWRMQTASNDDGVSRCSQSTRRPQIRLDSARFNCRRQSKSGSVGDRRTRSNRKDQSVTCPLMVAGQIATVVAGLGTVGSVGLQSRTDLSSDVECVRSHSFDPPRSGDSHRRRTPQTRPLDSWPSHLPPTGSDCADKSVVRASTVYRTHLASLFAQRFVPGDMTPRTDATQTHFCTVWWSDGTIKC